MKKRKPKVNGPYWEKLNVRAKQKYFEELVEIKNFKPYDLVAEEWMKEPDTQPLLTHPDILITWL
ncbi:RNA-directed DNA polymerase from mobile element jockey-like [Clarias magur]|uniref:RNA-directed DNA polymerase from mobile element jockey-like n=1 Tax=Clarias magur TaxID=1594786 RepID=A0A8J4X2J2_CLAMG|nr:RNA-directed DNA polymerase from mobile element jockey-like [Clarias magur]